MPHRIASQPQRYIALQLRPLAPDRLQAMHKRRRTADTSLGCTRPDGAQQRLRLSGTSRRKANGRPSGLKPVQREHHDPRTDTDMLLGHEAATRREQDITAPAQQFERSDESGSQGKYEDEFDAPARARRRVGKNKNDDKVQEIEISSRDGEIHASANYAAQSLLLNRDELDCGKSDVEPKVSVPIVAPSRVIQNRSTRLLSEAPRPSSLASLVPVDLFPKPTSTFAGLGLDQWLVRSLANMAIRRPTGIQNECIPQILRGRDCIGGSRTGTGKTVAFAAPILQLWARDPSALFAVVLTPTRELALQIYEQFRAIAAPHGGLHALLVTGGADMRPQAIELARSPDLVIATPGRLADHIRTSGEDTMCGLRRARFVVLDEADRLLDPRSANAGRGSMLPDVDECLGALPPAHSRQTLLFTATVTSEVLALRNMPSTSSREPPFVCEVAITAPRPNISLSDTSAPTAAIGENGDYIGVNDGVPAKVDALPASLDLRYVQVPVTHREHYLYVLLTTGINAKRPAIVFCNRASTADYLHRLLRLLAGPLMVTSLHSKLPQRQRIDSLARFRASASRVLVATDVAARGLDVPEVGLVINYDVPRDPDDFVHRVGRTARAGRAGLALTLVGQRDVDCILAIEDRVGRMMQPWTEEGINLDARVVRDALRPVSERKREALLEVDEGRDTRGKRKHDKLKLRSSA